MNEQKPSPSNRVSLRQRAYLAVENFFMSRVVPYQGPGPWLRRLFKAPLWLYRLGLGPLIGKHILILTTTGRKSGLQRRTPLEYGYDAATGAYQVMAGWAGRTDWYRNARAHPRVQVHVGRRRFDAVADPIPVEEAARALAEITRINPNAVKIWSRWAGEAIDPETTDWRDVAPYFPMLALRPLEKTK
ncbi:MAG: nitroreductase family deazaflavin-dependent oxidoreductase [Anaerolineae bacterium]|nr:nitroreductase family deazaflavin-dependent oxidoreductase [Anaerolineae bacterium]